MPELKSPPIAVAAATPWTWEGSASSLEYTVRFYPSSKAVADISQAGGTRDVTITVTDTVHYSDPGANQTTEHTGTLAQTPTKTVPAGEWQLLGLSKGRGSLTFVAVANTLPGGATHYRILVNG